MKQPRELPEVARDTVGHGALEVVPDELVRVEFGGVAREAIRVEPRMRLEEVLHQRGPVLPAAVPEKDHGTTQMAEQLLKELDDLGRPDVFVPMESGIEGRTSPARRDADGGDGRNFGPVAGTAQMRRVAPRRPGADHAGDQQEAALIEECQMGAKSSGLFLYGATETASTARWPLRLSLGRASPASGSSSCARRPIVISQIGAS